jgi:hypothetical protein
MRHLKEYESVMNEAQGSNASASIVDYEFTYKGLDLMASFDVEGRVYYEAPQREEGHGFHDVGGGMMVEDVEIDNLILSVSLFDKYVKVSDPAVEDEIKKFLLVDKDSIETIEEELIENYADSE